MSKTKKTYIWAYARGALDAVLSEYYPGTGGAPDEG